MIYSQLTNLSKYLKLDVYVEVEKFLKQVSEILPDGEYPILEDKVFARVMTYNTKQAQFCEIEAHDKYIDIQATINGAEGIGVYNRAELKESLPYNIDKDVTFYQREGAKQIAYTINIPGYFTMLFPEDAHSPQEKVLSLDSVKKFVIKVAV